MKKISLDNGTTYIDAADALKQWPLDDIAQYMDDDNRESVNMDIAPCTDLEFLTEYLKRAAADLVIG